MAKVQAVNVDVLGTINNLTVKYLTGDAEDITTTLYYELGERTELGNDANSQITDAVTVKVISNGNYHMTEVEYAAWGEDNSYLLTLVATHLGLTLI